MKKYSAILCLLLFALGCKKGDAIKKTTGLTGIWELRKDYGGIAGGTRVYAPGNGTTLQFNADSTFISYNKFKLDYSGTYQVVLNGLIIGQQKFDALHYNHSPQSTEIAIKGDTLTLGIDYDDMIASVYIRQ